MTQLAKATPSQRLFHAAHVERQKRLGSVKEAKTYAPPVVFAEPKLIEAIKKPEPVIEHPPVAKRQPGISKIVHIRRQVALTYGLKQSDLTGERRFINIARPRQIAMYLARTMLKRPWHEIGFHFGHRDHTTVIHAVRKIESLIAIDQVIASQVAAIRTALEVHRDN